MFLARLKDIVVLLLCAGMRRQRGRRPRCRLIVGVLRYMTPGPVQVLVRAVRVPAFRGRNDGYGLRAGPLALRVPIVGL